ncbi:hypothetical protein CC80DRAFT_593544 [Byssothecium circinans]|uniref:Uncharacterized protein n=1 Tax=Byssothecium circinans TaxID=147558 RepID=A0A6A5U6W1_9PLEO|nr:hypothetical protein CC80DRAFT_593544 [Byssothecium circinans]
MAVDMAQTSREPAVESSVHNLIHAFTDGLNVFKRLKERRRKRKSKHKSTGGGGDVKVKDDAESQLSISLRKGPVELQDTYVRCYGEKGEEFARGDAIAHASLAETLIKLNTGLVSIIATFLNHHHNSKNSNLRLDYKSLTSLSDASRREAMESLNQLYYRLSQSQIQLQRMASPKAEHFEKRGRSRSGSRSEQRINRPTVARALVKDSKGQTQLVIVRPKTTKKGSGTGSGSSSSASSTKSPVSTAVSSPHASPLGSPLPQYSPKDPFPPQKGPSSKTSTTGRKRADSFTDPRPSTWPHTTPDDILTPLAFPYGPFDPISPSYPPVRKSPQAREKQTPTPPNAAVAVTKRRLDKLTPSTYTFASDSTKLGEIPQRNWTTPWDYEEAERLNAVAAAVGVPLPVAAVQKGQKKKGLFERLRRGSASAGPA